MARFPVMLLALLLASVSSSYASVTTREPDRPGVLAPRTPRASETPRRPEELHLKPLEFSPRAPQRDTLACGVPVFLAENHDLPICDVTIVFAMGERYLPVERRAACEILGTTWRPGGTEALPPDSLDERLAALDAEITSNVGLRTGGISASFASSDVEAVLPVWRDIVLHPRFDPDRLEKAKDDRIRDLQAINNDPERIANERSTRLLQGAEYPTSHYETRAEIEAVGREDLLGLHGQFVHPDHAVIGVSGDFDRASIMRELNGLFAGWPRQGEILEAATWTVRPEPGVYLLPGDYEQSQVRILRWMPGITISSAEYPAAEILGFAFGYGRVFYRTREEGLSYGTAVMMELGDDYSDVWGFGSCRGDATVKLLRSMLDEMGGLKEKPITPEELETSRTFRTGTVVRSFETPGAIASDAAYNVAMGRPADFEGRYLDGLKSATVEDVKALSSRYITPRDSLIVFVLGNPRDFDMPLDSLGLGPVRTLDPVRFGE
jgi:zinc protease